MRIRYYLLLGLVFNMVSGYTQIGMSAEKGGDMLSIQDSLMAKKEMDGIHDNVHFLANYLRNEMDTIIVYYSFDMCLCPKWRVTSTNELVWIEGAHSAQSWNRSERDRDNDTLKMAGHFYKYEGIPVDLYDRQYLSGKYIPNARIFKVLAVIRDE